jgi:hypothetical protein
VIEGYAEPALGARDFGAEKGGPIAELGQEPVERGVQLVAEAASAIDDDFPQDSFLLENDRHPSVDIEILEWNRQ